MLFLIGVAFLVLAPVYWLRTEAPSGRNVARAHENLGLYHRVFPSFSYGFSRMRAGELPLWNPTQLCGTPFQADPQTGLFQPLNAVFFLWDTPQAMAGQAFLSLTLMGLFFALFIRSLDAGYTSAMAGGIVYAFNGASSAAMSRPELAATLAWAPLLFWALREYGREFRYGFAVLGGLALALMLLAGSPALTAAMLLLALPYAAILLLYAGRAPAKSIRERFRGVWIVLGTALAVSAIQWVPSLAWFLDLDDPFGTLWRLDLAGAMPATAQELVEHILTGGRGLSSASGIAFAGIASLLLMPAALFRRTGRIEALYFLLAGTACLLGATLESGADTMLPLRVLVFPGVFGVAVLVALGMDHLLWPGPAFLAFRVWLSILVSFVAGGVLLYLSSGAMRALVFLNLLALIFAWILRARWAAASAGLAVAALCYIDLATAHVNYYRHPYADAPPQIAPDARMIDAAEEQALGGRVALSAGPLNEGLSPNLGMLTRTKLIGGTALPLSTAQARWWTGLQPTVQVSPASPQQVSSGAATPALLNFMACRILIAAPGGPFSQEGFALEAPKLRPARRTDRVPVYVNDSALPRAYWVPSWRLSKDIEATLSMISGPDFDATMECAVSSPGRALEDLVKVVPDTGGSIPEVDWESVVCTIREDAPERVVISVEAPTPGVTVLADSFSPGWKARIDGEAVPIQLVNGLFRGVATPAGNHQIVMEYVPLPFWAGAAVSLASLGLLLAAGLFRFGLLIRRL